MGILSNANTWRAPLQLIDCWLPAPSARRTSVASSPLATRAMQRFARAGWLGRKAPPAMAQVAHASPVPGPRESARTACRVRVLRQTDPTPKRASSVRLVISGRINDVCAELDRLADQEDQVTTRAS